MSANPGTNEKQEVGEDDLVLSQYSLETSSEWDDLVSRAPTGTFLHTRRFLGYHRDRFVDCSVVIRRKTRLAAVFPAALMPGGGAPTVVSHPGITFGGLVYDESVSTPEVIHLMDLLRLYYKQNLSVTKLVYKAVPWIYHTQPRQADLYALFRLQALRCGCDLSSTIDLLNSSPFSESRMRNAKKAKSSGVCLVESPRYFPEFWHVLSENLAERFNKAPVHNLDEIVELHALFPNEIRLVTAWLDNTVIGGVVMFYSNSVAHAQYSATSHVGKKIHAQDLIYEHCIDSAREQGYRYFDFGISTESGGSYLNSGLYTYKSRFGSGATVYETYVLQ